jgi:NADH-quinone oxidoreductase subunit M
LPSTSNFVGELLIVVACFAFNTWVAIFVCCGILLGACYSLWLLNRILFGNVKQLALLSFNDLNRLEVALVLPFIVLMFLIGITPTFLTQLFTIF